MKAFQKMKNTSQK